MKYGLWALMLFAVTTAFADVKMTLHDSLKPLYPDTQIDVEQKHIQLHVPRNSVISTDLFFQDLTTTVHLNFEIESSSPALAHPKLFKLIDVPLEINTGIESRTEKWDGKKNPYVIRRAPFSIYEVLKPIGNSVTVSNKACAVRFMWKIPKELKPGEYELKIKTKGFTSERDVTVVITVHDTVLPDSGQKTYGYTNWFSPDKIAQYHHVQEWSDALWELLNEYAVLMHHGRQNMFWVRWRDFFTEVDGKPVLRQDRLERYIQLFTDAGVHYIEFSPIAHRTDGNWSSKTLSLFHKNQLVSSEEGTVAARSIMVQVRKVLERNQWTDRCRFHIADEPTDVLVADYRKTADLLKEIFPSSKIMEATMTRKLAGAVDIWCPQLQNFQQHRYFFEERRQAGDEIWVYSCLVPGGKWLNRLIDQERLRPVYIGWSLSKYDLGGFLHWGLNHWGADPFKQSVIDHFQAQGTNNQLPAGDTHVVYPGKDGPWSSTRFEAHRVGMEDAELFRLLKKQAPEKATTLMDKAFRSYNDYDTSVASYRNVRRTLLEALETGPATAQ